MANSKAFIDLTSSIKRAKKIGNRVPPYGSLKDVDDLKVRSLILLSHAAIEQYLEEFSLEIAKESLRLLQSNGVVNGPLLSLITFHKSAFARLFSGQGRHSVFKPALISVAVNAVDLHEKAINGNHGIKNKNQDSILLPIGVDTDLMDATLRGMLESFGNKRGGVAHSAGITTVHTRSDIEQDLRNIMTLVRRLDRSVVSMCKDSFHVF